MTTTRQRVVALRDAGHTYAEIATTLWLTRSAVAGHIRRHSLGIPERSKPAKPVERTPRKRRSRRGPNMAHDPEVRKVIDMIAESGLYDQDVADRAGVAKETIREWRRGIVKNPNKFLLECVREVVTP